MWSPVPRPGIATRPLPQGRGVLAPAPQGKPPARSYTGTRCSACVFSVFPPPYLCFSYSSTASRDPWASFGRVEQGAVPGVEDKLLRHCPVERPSPQGPSGGGRERSHRSRPRHYWQPEQGRFWTLSTSGFLLVTPWQHQKPDFKVLASLQLSLTYTRPTFPCPLASRLQFHQQWVRDQSTCLSG